MIPQSDLIGAAVVALSSADFFSGAAQDPHRPELVRRIPGPGTRLAPRVDTATCLRGVTSYKSGGLKRSTQHPARRESVKRKPKKAKAKRRGRSALICMSLQYNELRNCD